MLVVERYRPVPDVLDADRTPVTRALGIGAVSGAGAGSGRLAIRRHDRRRHADGARSPGGRGVLVLSGDADHDGRLRAQSAQGAASPHVERALEIAVGLVLAFVASALVVKPFLAVVRRSGFAPFAWYRIALGLAVFGSDCRRLAVDRQMQWLRRSFIAGFFVTVPLVISVAAFIWIFGLIDGLTAPFYDAWLQRMRSSASHTCRARHPHDRAVRAAGGRARDQRHRKAIAAADGRVPAARAGVPHDLRAGQTTCRRLLAGQRVRIQARRDGRGPGARFRARVSDARSSPSTADRARSR